jgi:perosamine synthetase
MISIYEPCINKYKKSALKAISDGWISNHGAFVELANNKLKEITGSKFSILMCNGTCATHCLFLALKFKHPNINTIYVPNNCYVAAWNAVLMEYQIDNLHVMKMDEKSWNICIDEEYLLSLEQNSAMLIVHNVGNIINVPRLKKIRPDIIFIEDNCEGMFGKYDNIYSGMSDDVLCSSCSFYGNKIITTGEGGAFFTQHKDIFDYINLVYSQGMSEIKYLHKNHAYNYRMTNLQSAFLYDQLNDIDNILNNKYKVFDNYNILLTDLVNSNKVNLIDCDSNTIYAPWIYTLRIQENTKSVTETMDFFKKENIDIRPFFYPINCHEHLKTIQNNDEISYTLNKEIIMIPSSPNITIECQQKVVNAIYKFVFYNRRNIKLIEVNNDNKSEIYDKFLCKINNDNFRYFKNRNITCLDNHIVTIVLQDSINNEYIGYAHIDYDKNYWFGIYINENYWGNGIGIDILRYILFNQKIKKIDNLRLTVDKQNSRAINLYHKYFKIIGETESYYIMQN